MTENKRFTYSAPLNGFCDIYDNGKILSCMRLEYVEKTVNLLNELYEENKRFKNKLKFLNELNEPYGVLIEENMRLKAFIKRLSNNCGEIILMNGIGYKVDKILGDMK